jgi:hypothetical protein
MEIKFTLFSYTVNRTTDPYLFSYFKLGIVGKGWGIIPWSGTVKYFQFSGAWSAYNIGQLGWKSTIKCPEFIVSAGGVWQVVPFAYSVQGPDSWVDNTCRCASDSYSNVKIHYYLEPYSVGYYELTFYPTNNGAIPTDILLWKLPSGGGGGCPYVSTWDGTRYVLDKNILPASELTFRLPNNENPQRTFILFTEGHYNTIDN